MLKKGLMKGKAFLKEKAQKALGGGSDEEESLLEANERAGMFTQFLMTKPGQKIVKKIAKVELKADEKEEKRVEKLGKLLTAAATSATYLCV